jgi:hypothetical protein
VLSSVGGPDGLSRNTNTGLPLGLPLLLSWKLRVPLAPWMVSLARMWNYSPSTWVGVGIVTGGKVARWIALDAVSNASCIMIA